jgi:DNA-binding SARP family transcriptional activator
MTDEAVHANPFLRTLGDFLLTDGRDGSPLMKRGKPLSLLAYCITERRRHHNRDALILLLWADTPPERARHNVRQALWRLRRVVGERLLTKGDLVTGVAPELESDRDLFLEAEARGDLHAALAHYRGPFLPGVSLPGADEFEDWATGERSRLEKALIRLIEATVGARLADYEPTKIQRVAAQLIERAPDSLDARRLAVELLLAGGDPVRGRREADALESLALAQNQTMSLAMVKAIKRSRAQEPSADLPTDSPASITLKLVGRDEQLSLATREWMRVRQGTSRGIVLEGVAGVGKSRLLHKIAEHCRRQRASTVSVRANPGEQSLPYSFAASLVGELAVLPGAAGVSTESALELVRLNPALARQFHVEETTGPRHDAQSGLRHRVLAVVDLVQAVTEQGAVALVIDDGHWIDDVSRRLLLLVLAHVQDVPLLTVATTRPGAHRLVVDGAIHHLLPPLSPTDLAIAIRGSGLWPDSKDADDFVAYVAQDCDGLPLTLVERLSLAVDAGIVQLHDGEWKSDDWYAAIRDLTLDSPMAKRLSACSDEERRLLRVLAVAGTPIANGILAPNVADAALLESLESKGFLTCAQGRWSPTHDRIAEELLARDNQSVREEAHRRLAEALYRSGEHERIAGAVRHWLFAADVDSAGVAFVRLVRGARARRDPRNATQLLDDLVGAVSPELASRVVACVPWHLRHASLKLRAVATASIVAAITSTVLAWAEWKRPALAFEQAPVASIEARLFGDGVVRLVPSPVIRIDGLPTGQTGKHMVVVRPADSSTRIIAGDSVMSDAGIARFGGLRLQTSDSAVRLRFESSNTRSIVTTVPRSKYGVVPENDGSLHLLDGLIRLPDGVQRMRGDSSTLRVAAGDTIDGVLQVAYSAPWAAASVWAAFTTTWGDPTRSGADLQPITTPVQWEVMDLRIRAVAPTTPGRHWILIVAGAEPSGGYLLSNTNWSVGRPIWGDGNDMGRLADGTIDRARTRGLVPVRIAYDASARSGCLRGTDPRWRYCDTLRGIVAIRVIVR